MLEMPHPLLTGIKDSIKIAKNCIDSGYIEQNGIIIPKNHYREKFLDSLPDKPSEYCKIIEADSNLYQEALIVTLYHLYRTIYYSKYVENYCVYLPHRFRSIVYRSSLIPRRMEITALAANKIRKSFNKIESTLGKLQDFTPNMPPIGDAIIRASENINQIETNIRELRSRAENYGYYEYMESIEKEILAGKRKITIDYCLEIEKAIAKWLEKLRIQKIERKISVAVIPGVVNVETKVKDKRISSSRANKHLIWMFDVLTWPSINK